MRKALVLAVAGLAVSACGEKPPEREKFFAAETYRFGKTGDSRLVLEASFECKPDGRVYYDIKATSRDSPVTEALLNQMPRTHLHILLQDRSGDALYDLTPGWRANDKREITNGFVVWQGNLEMDESQCLSIGSIEPVFR